MIRMRWPQGSLINAIGPRLRQAFRSHFWRRRVVSLQAIFFFLTTSQALKLRASSAYLLASLITRIALNLWARASSREGSPAGEIHELRTGLLVVTFASLLLILFSTHEQDQVVIKKRLPNEVGLITE